MLSIAAFIYAIVNVFINGECELFILIAILATFIVYRHRENIKRIKNGTEPKSKMDLIADLSVITFSILVIE